MSIAGQGERAPDLQCTGLQVYVFPTQPQQLTLSKKWQIIASMICQLKNLFGLERNWTESLGGLLTRLVVKVAVYTCRQLLNFGLGLPLRHLILP